MSDASSNLGLPYIMAAQAQKHVTHNEAITALDTIVQLAVVTRNLDEPPAGPLEGQRYIVSDTPSGDWSQQAVDIAAYQDGSWHFHTPREGWQVWVEDEQCMVVFTQGGWTNLIAQPPAPQYGSTTGLETVEDELNLSGGFMQANIQIPDRSIVLAVSVRVVTEITGATAFEVGTAAETTKFGGMLGTNPGDTNIGVIGPTAYYANTPLRITAIGGEFLEGTVHLALHIIKCGPPLS